MGSAAGAAKVAAGRVGLTVDQYAAHVAAGEKWCTGCKCWHATRDFGSDATRVDGLATTCLSSRRTDVPKSHKGRVSTFKGKSHTVEAKARMAAAKVGRPSGRLGKRHSPESRAKISAVVRQRALRGPAAPGYKDGLCEVRRGERFGAAYKRWRYDVFSRDGFACRGCGDARGGNLHAHHVKPFADHPGLRFEVGNGITLCTACHGHAHGYGMTPSRSRRAIRARKELTETKP